MVSPGATANGKFAHSPMASVASDAVTAVANSADVASMPDWERMEGLTIKI